MYIFSTVLRIISGFMKSSLFLHIATVSFASKCTVQICAPNVYMSAEYLTNVEQIFDKCTDIEYGIYSSVIQIIDV
jgi:hypothetical protein